MREGRHHPVSNDHYRPSVAGRTTLGAAVVLALLLTACPSDDSDETLRDVEVYRVVIADLVGDFTPDPPAPDENPIVFVESFVPGGISLEVQVELVSVFSEEYELRFVDERAEAVEDDLEDRPVRVGSTLVGLGPIVEDDPLTVRVELYADERNIRAFRFGVRDAADGGWDVDGAPEEVVPEGFVAST